MRKVAVLLLPPEAVEEGSGLDDSGSGSSHCGELFVHPRLPKLTSANGTRSSLTTKKERMG